MNITQRYERWSGSLILSSPSKTRQSNVWLLWHAGSEVSSLLKCGTTFTEVALAIREFFLVGKRVEGRWVLLQTIITAAERKHYTLIAQR